MFSDALSQECLAQFDELSKKYPELSTHIRADVDFRTQEVKETEVQSALEKTYRSCRVNNECTATDNCDAVCSAEWNDVKRSMGERGKLRQNQNRVWCRGYRPGRDDVTRSSCLEHVREDCPLGTSIKKYGWHTSDACKRIDKDLFEHIASTNPEHHSEILEGAEIVWKNREYRSDFEALNNYHLCTLRNGC